MAAKADKQKAIVRLTEKSVERYALAVGEERREVYDEYLPRLALRIGRRSKSWSVMYRVATAGELRRGELKRLSLGSWPVIDLKAARDRAREALEAADRGIDPAARRTLQLVEQTTQTFDAVFRRFVDLHVKQNTKEGRFSRDRAAVLSAAAEGKAVRVKGPKTKLGRSAAERIIADNALPVWGGRLIETIKRAEVHDLLDGVVTTKGEARARELRKHLTKMFNWAADRGHLPASPLAGMRRPELGYVARERVLTMEELGRVWEAAGEVGYPFGPMVRLLILTGQRRSEIAELELGWVDHAQKAVEIPASRYKTKRAHVFPLSPPAWAIVEELPKWNGGDCVFTTTSGERPVSGFSKSKARLDALITKLGAAAQLPPLAPWTVHDVRRSVATHMARLGIPQEHIERVLGHVVAGVAGTYNRYSYLDEKRSALDAWGQHWKS